MRVVIYCFLLLLPNIAHAWWSNEWTYRMPIVVSSPAGSTETAVTGDNVVLIKMHAGNFSDFFSLQENLADLRFISEDDKTPLNYQVDSFDLVNQLLFVWVNVPGLSSAPSTKIWMYYGNAKAVAPTDFTTTYDANQSLVVHFNGAESGVVDATAYKNKISLLGGEVSKASLIGSGLKMAGDTQLHIEDSPALLADLTKGFTFSTWIKPGALDGNAQSLFSRADGKGNSLDLFIDAASITAQINYAGKLVKVQAAKAIDGTTWSHVALVMDQNKLHLYVNGEEVKSDAISGVQLAGPISIGGKSPFASGFKGELDEPRLFNVPVSQKALLMATKNQGMVDEIVALQAPEQQGSESSGSGGLIAVIFKNLDDIGWVVLGIMIVMSFISWLVMGAKALYLRRVRKDNTAFLKEYAKLIERDPATLDSEEDDEFADAPIMQAVFGNHDHYQSSTIYHLYHRGIFEIRNREKSIQLSGLTQRAIDALRAAIDAQLVREVQRLNSLMVLLTIAISGGPFIGLFGTVMGVMLTFAAIAKTGDVNIAAIAPGVAAALLTTLGGLFVAIPALFGYNYLSSRIKESVADMRVFTDEFITRLAEYYGRS